MMARAKSLEVEVKDIQEEVEASWAPVYRTADRALSVKAAIDRAVVSKVADRAAGRGWFGVIVVRDLAITAAVSSGMDCLSVQAIERGRGRRLIVHEFAGIVRSALDNSGLTISADDHYWFIACAIHKLLLHPWFSSRYGENNQARYFRHYAAVSSRVVETLRAPVKPAGITMDSLITYYQKRGRCIGEGAFVEPS